MAVLNCSLELVTSVWNDSGNSTEDSLYNGTNSLMNKNHFSKDEMQILLETYVYPKPYEWVLIALYLVLFPVGLLGNGLVCFVVWKCLYMRTVTNLFIGNLAVSDFLVILVCLPPSVISDVTETWFIGEGMCRVVHFLQTMSVSVSVFSLSAISVERYYAICKPLKLEISTTTIIITIMLIWLFSAAVAMPEMVYMKLGRTFDEELTGLLTYCELDMGQTERTVYQMVITILLYVLPVSLMTFTYSIIALHLWRSSKTRPTVTSVSECTKSFLTTNNQTAYPQAQLKSRRKAAKMLMVVVTLFAACFLPIHLFNIIKRFGSLSSLGSEAIAPLALLVRWLCYFNSAINPVVYNFMSAKFRKEFKFALSRCCRNGRRSARAPTSVYYSRSRSNNHRNSLHITQNTKGI